MFVVFAAENKNFFVWQGEGRRRTRSSTATDDNAVRRKKGSEDGGEWVFRGAQITSKASGERRALTSLVLRT